jgi:hypothetical protein
MLGARHRLLLDSLHGPDLTTATEAQELALSLPPLADPWCSLEFFAPRSILCVAIEFQLQDHHTPATERLF